MSQYLSVYEIRKGQFNVLYNLRQSILNKIIQLIFIVLSYNNGESLKQLNCVNTRLYYFKTVSLIRNFKPNSNLLPNGCRENNLKEK